MINKILKTCIRSFILSLLLMAIGAVIFLFIKGPETRYQDILFWVGAIPVFLFTFGVFGDFFTKADPSYQLARSISDQSSNERAHNEMLNMNSILKSHTSWIVAGLLVWGYSTFF